jgi:putative mRNA 3-end processing factor
MRMFHFDRGLKLTELDLAIDFRRRQPRGFISHAHADHMAPHELAFCTPVTGRLYRERLGKHRAVKEMPFGQTLNWNDWALTTHAAGHVFGSAMLLAERSGRRLLYTGDFKLGESATAETCQPPRAEVLVMESTWGDAHFVLPKREQVVQQLIDTVAKILEQKKTPVVHAYVLGKAQEVTKILTQAGMAVLQHPLVYAISKIYEEYGCALGNFREYAGCSLPGHVVVAPPKMQKGFRLANLQSPVSIAVTGWALDSHNIRRWGTDYAIPLTDHADFEQLLECVELVDPEIVHCTHGPVKFVEHLRQRGKRAVVLGASEQLQLF